MNRIWFPFQRAVRTFLQVVVATVVFLAGLLAFLQVFVPQLLEALREVLPADVYAWGIGAIAVLGVIAATLSRVMAIPAVDAFLRRFGAGSAPKHSQVVTLIDGTALGMTRAQYRDYTREQK